MTTMLTPSEAHGVTSSLFEDRTVTPEILPWALGHRDAVAGRDAEPPDTYDLQQRIEYFQGHCRGSLESAYSTVEHRRAS